MRSANYELKILFLSRYVLYPMICVTLNALYGMFPYTAECGSSDGESFAHNAPEI